MATLGVVISTAVVGVGLLARGRAAGPAGRARLGAGLRRPGQPDRPGRRPGDAQGGAGPGDAGDRHGRQVAVQRRRRRRGLHRAAGRGVGRRRGRGRRASPSCSWSRRWAGRRSGWRPATSPTGRCARSTTTRSRCWSRWRWSPAPMRWRTGCTSSGPIAVVVAGLLVGNRGPLDAHERPDPALPVRLLAAGRRDAERGAVPADRAGGPGPGLRRGLGRAGRGGGAAGADRPARGRLRAGAGRRRGGPALRARDDPGADLGRAARRHLGGARAVAAGRAGKTPILAATYTVVVFTIVAQGLSLRALVRRTVAG